MFQFAFEGLEIKSSRREVKVNGKSLEVAGTFWEKRKETKNQKEVNSLPGQVLKKDLIH